MFLIDIPGDVLLFFNGYSVQCIPVLTDIPGGVFMFSNVHSRQCISIFNGHSRRCITVFVLIFQVVYSCF